MVIAVPVIVKLAVRSAPVLGARENWTVPFPDMDAPWVTVMNAALLTAVQAQLAGVLTAMDADPPAAANVVVVTPVMITQEDVVEEPPGATVLPVQAIAIRSSAAEKGMRVRRES